MPNHLDAVPKCRGLLGIACVVLLAGTAPAGAASAGPAPASTAAEESATAMSLAGTWRFQLDRDDAGAKVPELKSFGYGRDMSTRAIATTVGPDIPVAVCG